MEKIKDIYIKLLFAAVMAFLIGLTFILSDLYYMVYNLDHDVMHLKEGKNMDSCNRSKKEK